MWLFNFDAFIHESMCKIYKPSLMCCQSTKYRVSKKIVFNKNVVSFSLEGV